MLRVAYIATEPPLEKPQKLTMSQRIAEEAKATVALARHRDAIKAKSAFPELDEEIRILQKEYDNLNQ
jgi:hypothetical protein